MSERQRLYRTHALILRRRDYRDADRILTIFTPNYGKLEVIAKGVRKTTSRKAGHLELFSHSSLLIAQARTWDIVTEAVNVAGFTTLRANLDRIGMAGYLCELVDCFTESGDENQPLWDLILLALHELDNPVAPVSLLLLQHWFELHLLSHTGFQPQLFQCLACDEELTPVTNFIHLAEGGVYCPNCAPQSQPIEPIDADVLKVMRFLQSRQWPVVRQVAVRPHILQRVGNLLYRYLLTILERHLKSVDFLRRLQHMPPPLAPAQPISTVPISTAPIRTDSISTDSISTDSISTDSISTEETGPHAHP